MMTADMATPTTVTVRSAEPNDATALAGLLTELGFPASAATVATRLVSLLATDERVRVAECSGEILGLITVHVTPMLHRPTPVGRITTLVVAERAHGRGIGRALVADAERLLAERGCALVEVTSNLKRGEAHAFYEHLGYERTSARFKRELDLAT